MGRVRRYKKYKAIDPFSKRGGRGLDAAGSSAHDEPPDIHERKSAKRRQLVDKELDVDEIMRREGIRALKNEQNIYMADHSATAEDGGLAPGVPRIAPKGEDETMREFKTRIRNETRKTLHEELRGMTATAQKRKERLKERKQKRKNKGKPETYKEEVMEFNTRSDGYMRPSDLGTSSADFARAEAVPFGAQSQRPPDLGGFALGKRKAGDDGATGTSKRGAAADPRAAGSNEISAKTAGARFLERQKLREGREAFMKSLSSSGGGAEEVEAVEFSGKSAKKRKQSDDSGDGSAAGNQLTGRDLEEARKRAIEAYKQLREKRIKSN